MDFVTRLFGHQLVIEPGYLATLYLQRYLVHGEDALPAPDVHR